MKFIVKNAWNGSKIENGPVAEFDVQKTERGMEMKVTMNNAFHRVPDAPIHTSVDGLWEYDVAELFFVLDDGRYIEFEVDRAGHYLLLKFDDVRKRSDQNLPAVQIETVEVADGVEHQIVIPASVFDGEVVRANAFGIVGDQFLAWSSVPGEKPDFHQPNAYPEVDLS